MQIEINQNIGQKVKIGKYEIVETLSNLIVFKRLTKTGKILSKQYRITKDAYRIAIETGVIEIRINPKPPRKRGERKMDKMKNETNNQRGAGQ